MADRTPAATLVVAVDFSEPSRHALEAATRLAHDLGAKILLVHALPAPKIGQGVAGGALHRDLVQAKAELQEGEALHLSEWAEAARRDGAEVETLAVEGKPDEVVLAAAQDHDAQIIVVGSHGRSGLSRALLGSVAERILRGSDRPVLVVPSPKRRD